MKIIFVKFWKLSPQGGFKIEIDRFFEGSTIHEAVEKIRSFLEHRNAEDLIYFVKDIKVLSEKNE